MKKEIKKKEVCRHKNTEVESCGCCGHTEEYCLDCGKARCSDTGDKWTKIY